jgi:phosphopantothenoylcysteine decarboxylase/phosphopantothenate--cysteine ligase
LVAHFTPKVLQGKRLLITAGPTYEAIDPVRGITNLSSGKMGFAIAEAAANAGAIVTLVAGPVALGTPRHVQRFDVRSAQEMFDAVQLHTNNTDIFIATAAVADWRPTTAATQKIKKDGSNAVPSLSFIENPDILATVAASASAKSGQLYCVGFAAESENLEEHAKAKRERKNIPLLVGNIGPATFGMDDNALLLVDKDATRELPRTSKIELARQLVVEIANRIK